MYLENLTGCQQLTLTSQPIHTQILLSIDLTNFLRGKNVTVPFWWEEYVSTSSHWKSPQPQMFSPFQPASEVTLWHLPPTPISSLSSQWTNSSVRLGNKTSLSRKCKWAYFQETAEISPCTLLFEKQSCGSVCVQHAFTLTRSLMLSQPLFLPISFSILRRLFEWVQTWPSTSRNVVGLYLLAWTLPLWEYIFL